MAESQNTTPSAGHEPKSPDSSGPLPEPRQSPGGAGRRLRTLAGVDEGLLSWVPTERPRYAALGGVVLGTATIAAFSMFLALGEVLGHVGALIVVPALVWGLFVLNLDRWLVSSSTGSRWARRTPLLLPRLLLAALFGVVIAEPLVLRIFQTAVEEYILDGRAERARTLESTLIRCNPVPKDDSRADALTSGVACAQHKLELGTTPATDRSQLARLRADAASLQRTIGEDERTQTGLDDRAVEECNGDKGPGLTGVRGDGPECRSRQKTADNFRAAAKRRETELRQIWSRIFELERKVRAATESFEQRRKAAIDHKVQELRSHQGAIGLLERFQALDELVHRNTFLRTARWVIRGFITVVDCLPVLVKLFSGTTSYERLVERQQSSAERMQAEAGRISERSFLADLDLGQHEAQSIVRQRLEEIDLGERQHVVTVNSQLDAAVEALAADLLRGAPAAGTVNGSARVRP